MLSLAAPTKRLVEVVLSEARSGQGVAMAAVCHQPQDTEVTSWSSNAATLEHAQAGFKRV